MGQEPRRPSRGIAFSNWLVSRTSRALEHGTSRRGFLIGSAMVGSAVAVAGVDYATRPSTAYAAIVPGGCAGGQCTDGYTEFCCAINNGINACPPNTFAGGWWRADSSSFCGGGTRYYIDCMQNCCGRSTNYCQNGYCFCESCVECQCAGDCNTRRVYCNYFRYGQCHTEIAISGPIACRVVSCTPPYAVAEYACLSSPAVDNSTAEHAANCAVNVEPTSTAAVLPASGMATTTGPGRVSLFVRGGGAAVYVRDFIDPNWTPFALVGGVITSGIAAAAGNGLEYLLARGGDNAIWGNRRAGGPGNPWSGWHTLGGAIRSDPVAVATGSDVFVLGRGLDDGAYVNRFNGTAWLGYTALGGKIDSEPVAVAYQSGVMVVARGIDGMLYANRFTGSWSGWGGIGIRATSDPACAVDANGVHVFVRDTNNSIRTATFAGSWSGWTSLGGTVTSDPIAAADTTGVHVVVLGGGNGLWHNRIVNGSPSGWISMGGVGSADPAIVADGGRSFVFVRGGDAAMWYGTVAGSAFSGWQPLGGVIDPTRAS